MNKKLHRWINTSFTSIALAGLIFASAFGYGKYEELVVYKSEMNQIVEDEGFRKCAYNDSLGYRTIGFGHLVKPDESFDTCITAATAFDMLEEDFYSSMDSVGRRYPWASGEVQLVLVNMTYQLGENGLSKFKKTLQALKEEDYRTAALEMLNSKWAQTTPNRSMRLAVRVLSLQEK